MKLLLGLALLLIPGCSWFKPEPVVVTKIEMPQINHPEFPAPVNLDNPYFYVVSPANIDDFLQRIEAENDGVFIALTPGDYEILANNIQELRRYILESQQIIVYYRNILSAERQNSETP